MLPGFGGQLVSEGFLEARRPADFGEHDLERLRRSLANWRGSCEELGPASSLRSMLEVGAAPLVSELGFDSMVAVEPGDTAVMATIVANSRAVVLVVAAWGGRLDPLWRPSVTRAIRGGADWALLFNGTHLRVLDARQLFARRYADFDLDAAADDPRTFAALWTLASAGAMTGGDPAAPRATPLAGLVAASDAHASGVCRSLREGVLSASTDVLGALAGRTQRGGPVPVGDTFEQALTIVYRILFLLFAEARALVPMWHPVYRDSYSLEALRASAERPPLGRGRSAGRGGTTGIAARGSASGSAGLWDALRATAHLAHAGCRAGDLRVTPFNGRLFAPERTPLAERRDLDDEAAKRAVLALATRPSAAGAGRERIAYRDLGVEQLGAVYETLLDYEPHVSPAHGRDRTSPGQPRRPAPAVVRLVPGSGNRKTTGTFYTPQPIAEHLVRQALAPLVRGATTDQILQLRIADPAMGSGAFLVAACRYLAAAYETALTEGGGCHPADIGEQERALIRRTIAERCLYGVDVNPMAVQLARLSMWLTTLAADRPLSFLDHRLQTGDSLLGAWLSCLGRAPGPGPRKPRPLPGTLPLFDAEAMRGVLQSVVPRRFSLESIPNDTLDQVRAKERTLAAMAARDGSLSRWKRVADLWCASWLSTPAGAVPAGAFSELSDRILTGQGALPAAVATRYLQAAEEVSAASRVFHWELEFPEVFFAADGGRLERPGFDAVIGNPPWEMIRADTGSAESRALARDAIQPVMRFVRGADVYRSQTAGHPNRYQLFVERGVSLTRPGGRLGLVLPAGFATDRGSAGLRSLLLSRCNVDAIAGLDNRRGVFPIHQSVSFLLVTATAGSPTTSIACRFGVEDPVELQSAGDDPAAAAGWYPVRLSPMLLRHLSGDDLVIPLARSPLDVAIAERAATLFPALGSVDGWSARFGRELNATDDRGAFRPRGDLAAAPSVGLPIVEGKLLEPFRVRLDEARQGILERDARRLLSDRRFERARLAYRDVASATNRLTLIAAVLPGGSVSTHTVFCLRTRLSGRDQHFLCGLFNSFVVNYLVRSRVTTHVTTATVERLPIPTVEHARGAHRDVAALATSLARRFEERTYAALQARVARLYQLSAPEFEHVLSTFPLVPKADRDAALAAFVAETEGARR